MGTNDFFQRCQCVGRSTARKSVPKSRYKHLHPGNFFSASEEVPSWELLILSAPTCDTALFRGGVSALSLGPVVQGCWESARYSVGASPSH